MHSNNLCFLSAKLSGGLSKPSPSLILIPPETANINSHLPEECLILVLSRVPLSDILVRASLVCQYWCQVLVPAVLLTKRSLLIASNRQQLSASLDVVDLTFPPLAEDPEKTISRANCLVLGCHTMNHITSGHLKYLTRKLSNIRKLDIRIRHYGRLNSIISYLACGWPKNQLVALKVVIRDQMENANTNGFHLLEIDIFAWSSFFKTVTEHYRHSIQSLTVYDSYSNGNARMSLPGPLPNLHTFYLGLYVYLLSPTAQGGERIVAEKLNQYFPQLRRFALIPSLHPQPIIYDWFSGIDLKYFFDIDHEDREQPPLPIIPKFLRQLTHFVSDFPLEYVQPIETLQARLFSPALEFLNSLSITTQVSLEEFLSRSGLHRLPHLLHLEVCHRSFSQYPLIRDIYPPLAFSENEQSTLVAYKTLKSLTFSPLPHCDFWCWALNNSETCLLPSLLEVNIKKPIFSFSTISECSKCASLEECNWRERETVRSLVCLPSLKIVRNRNRILTRNDLLLLQNTI